MNRSHAPRRRRGILVDIARRLRAFYQVISDDSAKEAGNLFDRAMQQSSAASTDLNSMQ